jgi:hypothetical protein
MKRLAMALIAGSATGMSFVAVLQPLPDMVHSWCRLLNVIARSRSLLDQKGSCVAISS